MTSGIFGLDVTANLSASSPIAGVISIDNSSRVAKFWEQFTTFIVDCKSPAEMQVGLIELLSKHKDTFFPKSTQDQITIIKDYETALNEQISSGQSWLSNQTKFDSIKSLFANKTFVHLTQDLSDPKTTTMIQVAMKTHSLKFAILYLSNIREVCEGKGELARFQEAMGKLQECADEHTLVIEVELRPGGLRNEAPLTQKVFDQFHQTDPTVMFPPNLRSGDPGKHPQKRQKSDFSQPGTDFS